MSSIEKFISKVCVQDAVYWGNPRPNGTGVSFDYPREIKCRWEDNVEVVVDRVGDNKNGKEIVCKSQVMVTEDLDEQGFLYLGSLDDSVFSGLSSAEEINPLNVDGAYEIQRFSKIPMIFSTSVFVRTAYL